MNARFWLAFVAACLTSAGIGYVRGSFVTTQVYEAELARMAKQQAQERETIARRERDRMEAVAEAERLARQRMRESSEKATLMAQELANAKKQMSEERQHFNRRLAYVSEQAGALCPGLPGNWVRLYNEATRPLARPGTASGNRATPPAGVDPTSGSAAASEPGVRELLTTPADVLAHARDYGNYCRQLEAQLNSLLPLVTP